MADALTLTGIRKTFDGFVALDDAHFTLRWGEVHALLGENGAGKSSLMNIAAGLYAPEAGSLHVDDNPVRFSGPRDAAAYRIGMVHQHFKLVPTFTVAENILLGMPRNDVRSHRQRLASLTDAIRTQASALGFAIEPERRVDTLSIAEQQRVEILKVLLAGGRIVILDEPTAVLTDAEAARLLDAMKALARQGAAVALVTHKIADVRRHADRVTIMRAGRTVSTLDPRTTSESELVGAALGEALPPTAREPGSPGRVRFAMRGVSTASRAGAPPMLKGLDLAVRAGEIYGLAGVGGNGQSELVAAIMGIQPIASGTIELDDARDIQTMRAEARRALGIATIPADRYRLALAGALSIADNFGVAHLHEGRYGGLFRIDRRRLAADAQTAVTTFDVRGVRNVQQKAALLSGGNAQKLVIAREFGRAPRFVVAHSPSRGLDVRAAAQVHARLRAARDAGAAVLLISEDLDEILSIADRIGVISRGAIVAEFDAPGDRHAIGQAMIATHDDARAESPVFSESKVSHVA
ncbi:ABC transporter ATP-binding protein [Pararobbsia silviterrae]|uniref:ABC transporter ATP-binding protein n=1 Tax=Pararobbsia silviterrae TaxID=1792498 RepID=A0A494Y004_9BURK|nr:ABC transporter ATP-binding protein [Pararobbsia silviterrae]RKP53691.1 ABC transporter ATP-binding protein [Pararobbsia silviterrae]